MAGFPDRGVLFIPTDGKIGIGDLESEEGVKQFLDLDGLGLVGSTQCSDLCVGDKQRVE